MSDRSEVVLARETLSWLDNLTDDENWARFEAWLDGLTNYEFEFVAALLGVGAEATEVMAA